MREYAALKSHGSDLCQLFITKYVFFVVTIRINVKIHQKQNVVGPKHLMQIRYKNNALSLFFVVSLTSYLQSQSELYHVSSLFQAPVNSRSWSVVVASDQAVYERYLTIFFDLLGELYVRVCGKAFNDTVHFLVIAPVPVKVLFNLLSGLLFSTITRCPDSQPAR